MTASEPLPARRGLPTSYAGHVFRSRLEARFAVLFDAMDIRWEYEPEGFELPHGLYVPDFWLPDLRTWFEVKPDWELLTEEPAWSLLNDLRDATRQSVVGSYGLGSLLVLFRTPAQRVPEAGYFAYLQGGTGIAALPDEGQAGPFVLRSAAEKAALLRAHAATFERPDRIPAYPLVAR